MPIPADRSPTVPLTEFRIRKLNRLFDVLDHDGDGAIELADFIRRVERFAKLRGWEQGSPEYLRNLRFALGEWQNLRESADADEDRQITRREFLRYAEVYLSERDGVRAFAHGDVQLIFDAMDLDGDGRLSIDEYRDYLEVCGIDRSAADRYFAHADLDEDGAITRQELSHAMEEFLISENPDSASNLLYGALDEPIR
jgi:Ca2+-binding EF-hand superfamily protein